MGRRIAIVQGHPDPAPERFCRELAGAYAGGAREAGHEVRVIEVAGLDFPLLRRSDDWEKGPAPEGLREAQATLAWAEHLVIVYPLWLGDMPALLKGFLEQALRPGIAFRYVEHGMPEKLFTGKSARIVVTMGMPSILYALFFRAHSVKSLARNILAFVGVSPVRTTLLGPIASKDGRRNRDMLGKLAALGRQGR